MRKNSPKARITPTFAKEELQPSTGSPVENMDLATARACAVAVGTYDGIYLQHDAHKRVYAGFDYLRELGLAGSGPKRGMRVIGPSSAGKTTAIEQYKVIDARRREPCEGVVPVLSVKLDRACTTKRFVTSALDEYGDEYSEASVESALRKRLYECIRRFRTELIIVDEVQHLNYRSSERSDPTDALKRMLDDGIVPLVFVGNEEALPLMKRNIQLANRMIAPGDMHPLRMEDAGDRATFRSFVRQLDGAMVKRGVMPSTANLVEPRMQLCLFVVSGGLLGRVVNLVRIALEIAVRRGAAFVEPHDLSKAVRDWALPQGIIGYDPFSQGVPRA